MPKATGRTISRVTEEESHFSIIYMFLMDRHEGILRKSSGSGGVPNLKFQIINSKLNITFL